MTSARTSSAVGTVTVGGYKSKKRLAVVREGMKTNDRALNTMSLLTDMLFHFCMGTLTASNIVDYPCG